MVTKVIAICNQKGGVGKTARIVNLGIGLARKRKKVLLADMDAQGSLTTSLGYEPEILKSTIAAVIEEYINDKELAGLEEILHHKKGVTYCLLTLNCPDWKWHLSISQ